MLHYQTINTKILGLLNKLMQVQEFKPLRLTGDTALALQLGHRRSADIDLFGEYSEDTDFGNLVSSINTKNTWVIRSPGVNIFNVDGIKVQFKNYLYHWLENEVVETNLRLAGISDIAAMKLKDLSDWGAKKDFVDLYFILQKYSFEIVLGFYRQKYDEDDVIPALKNIADFIDADSDNSNMPPLLKQANWTKIKAKIKKEVRKHIK